MDITALPGWDRPEAAAPGPCTSPGCLGHLSLLIPWLSSLGLPLPVTALCSLCPQGWGHSVLPVTITGQARAPSITSIPSWRSQIPDPSPESSDTLLGEQGKVSLQLSPPPAFPLTAPLRHQHLLQRFWHDWNLLAAQVLKILTAVRHAVQKKTPKPHQNQ